MPTHNTPTPEALVLLDILTRDLTIPDRAALRRAYLLDGRPVREVLAAAEIIRYSTDNDGRQ